MRGRARSILLAGVISVALSPAAGADDVQVIVTYENPEVILEGCGLPFGFTELPPQVHARFVFPSSELPPPSGPASFPTVTEASLVFGGYEMTETQLIGLGEEIGQPQYPGLPPTSADRFHIALDGAGGISGLGYGSKCSDDASAQCRIAINHSFQLDLFGEDVWCGASFPENVSHYRYASSRQVVVPVQDSDSDGIDDFYDACLLDPANDADQDGVCGDADNCSAVANTEQSDADADGVGDVCDNCKCKVNGKQSDRDGDGAGDLCDLLPKVPVGLCLVPPLSIDARDQTAINCTLLGGLPQVCL
jgi:hypothetical protein